MDPGSGHGAGKAAPVPRRRVAASLLAATCLALAVNAPARAIAGDGRTASASITISVSVAPKYGLAATQNRLPAAKPGPGGENRFCLATNGEQSQLPVMLIWPSHDGLERLGRPAFERAALIGPCRAGGELQTPADRPGMKPTIETVMVRPE